MMTKTVKLAKINGKFNNLKRFSIGFVILLNYLRVQSKLYMWNILIVSLKAEPLAEYRKDGFSSLCYVKCDSFLRVKQLQQL